MTERAEDFQLEVLRAFTFLCALRAQSQRADWGGELIVGCGLGRGGTALALAGNIAGAGCLAIDARTEACRAALHRGACDFVVNTVDEALRILKNQIRKRSPVSVGLTLSSSAALDELIERGVLPQIFTAFRPTGDTSPALANPTGAAALDRTAQDRAALRFAALGTQIVDFDGLLTAAGRVDTATPLQSYTQERGLRLASFGFASGEQLRAFDARLLRTLPTVDARARWCAAAPRFFHRERPHRRVVFLTDAEVARLGEFGSPV